VSFTGNYTLSKAIDEVLDYNSDFQANDQTNLRAERALSSFDQRHKFVAYAFLEGPRESAGNGTLSRVLSNFSLSPLLRLNSARPFNLLTGTELNVSSAMGLVLLVGLVVKNGIVLLDYAERERLRGIRAEEAVYDAARVRLRPILMTTLCTLFGLVPLALGIGAGAELQRPLALAVIGGLSLSTVITVYLIPALYAGLYPNR